MAITKVDENKTLAESTDKIDGIQPLKIKAINGFRARFEQIFKKWAVLGVAGGIAGFAVGKTAQTGYRDWTGYNPDEVKQEEISGNDEQKEEEKKEAEGLMGKALQKLQAAKDWATDKVSDNVITRQIEELKEIYKKMLEAGDKIAFWLPFLFTFLATVILMNKAIKLKKNMTERVDPVVESNMQLMEKKINELIVTVNQISRQNFVSTEQQMEVMSQMKNLLRELEANQLAAKKEVPKPVSIETKDDVAA